MYLIIDVNEVDLFLKEEITEHEITQCDDGFIAIVNMETQEEYVNGSWESIEKV